MKKATISYEWCGTQASIEVTIRPRGCRRQYMYQRGDDLYCFEQIRSSWTASRVTYLNDEWGTRRDTVVIERTPSLKAAVQALSEQLVMDEIARDFPELTN